MVRDTAADPQQAAAAVDELARLGVAALAGEYHSVVARAAAARADALGLPFLCSSAVLDALTDEPTDWVARLAPPQSRGWRIYADFLLERGAQPHRRGRRAERLLGGRDPHPARPPSTRWHVELDAVRGGVRCSSSTAARPRCCCWSALPEPAASIVAAVRRDPRLADILIGAPAGQPEFAGWRGGIPFLRYLPERLSPLGESRRVRDRLGGAPSFVAFEGYDTILVARRAPARRGVLVARRRRGHPRGDPVLPRPGHQRLAVGVAAGPGGRQLSVSANATIIPPGPRT